MKHLYASALFVSLLIASVAPAQSTSNSPGNTATLSPPAYIIPVVFHIIHDYGTENISDAQVLDALAKLNEDFRKQNGDTSQIVAPFDTLAADAQIEFHLAHTDPNGNCTNGIERIASMETYVGDDGSKLNPWPRDKYLNIWIVKESMMGIAAYAYNPVTVAPIQMMPFDGVLILHSYVGTIGTGSPALRHFMTQQVATWIGLPPIWGSGPAGVTCGDDGIADTPVTKGWPSCQLTNTDVCNPGIPENVQNFMDVYCGRMFTPGQRDYMHMTLNMALSQRNNLWTNANLNATGVLNPPATCAPHADFKSSKRMICTGDNVSFTDLSWGSAATSWQWTLSGPVTLTSTSQNPSFTSLTAPGTYAMTLIASNSTGVDTIVKLAWLTVVNDTAPLNALYSESFETPNVFALGYIVNDRYGNGSMFSQTFAAGHTGNGSAMLDTYGNSIEGDVDELITPAYDLQYVTGMQLSFVYAYATAATSPSLNTQVFKVYSSTNCGSSWNLRWSATGPAMVTAGFNASSFVPSSAADWDTVIINLPASLAQSKVLFKFEYTSPEDNAGNNLYIDDINILSTNVGVDEHRAAATFSIYPNPGDGNAVIAYTLEQQASVQYYVYDVSGRLLSTKDKGEQAAGNYTAPVSETNALVPGTYLVQVVIDGVVHTQRYMVTAR